MNRNLIFIIVVLIAGLLIWGIYYIMQNQNTNSIGPNTAGLSAGGKNVASRSFEIQGMNVEVISEGSGAEAKAGDNVAVDYSGFLQNGTKFDSSIDRGLPFEFTLGQNNVIQGWELGVAGMKVGEKRKLTIPPALAYGDQAVGGVIPANSTLIFEVEMKKIN